MIAIGTSRPVTRSAPRDLVGAEVAMLGGRVGIHLGRSGDAMTARRTAHAGLRRIEAWAAHLTRFDPASDLCRLNADRATDVPVAPTLAAVLDWGRTAEAMTDGIVNIAMLDERLAAELGAVDLGAAVPARAPAEVAARRWSLSRGSRRTIVHRTPGVHFDLDGVGKGWLADRALDTLRGWSVTVVDADGDVAVRLGAGEACAVGIADPARAGMDLLVLRLNARPHAIATRLGVATSGTTNHRWSRDGVTGHHLIDPRTGRPAVTDLVQATVVARTAGAAEALAKTAVILGSEAALAALDRDDVEAVLLLTEDGRLLLTPGATRLVA